MARKTRKISATDLYHVILRGVNKQRIFEQEEDYGAFCRIMKYVRDTDSRKQPVSTPNYFLYAYCIMDNHVHLLIQPNGIELGRIMTRIMTTYAIYFNNTYERVGHLFQDRYKSEPVESQGYFFELLNYIHRNPVSAHICEQEGQYLYSSYNELSQSGKGLSLCCFPTISTVEEMAAENHRYAMALLEWHKDESQPKPRLQPMNMLGIPTADILDFVSAEGSEPGLHGLFERVKQMVQGSDAELMKKLRAELDWQTAEEKDQAVVNKLLEMTGAENISAFQRLDKPTMRTALAIMRDSGVARQRLSRLTGISEGIIRYAKA